MAKHATHKSTKVGRAETLRRKEVRAMKKGELK